MSHTMCEVFDPRSLPDHIEVVDERVGHIVASEGGAPASDSDRSVGVARNHSNTREVHGLEMKSRMNVSFVRRPGVENMQFSRKFEHIFGRVVLITIHLDRELEGYDEVVHYTRSSHV